MEPERVTSNVDFLSKLPVEIWRNILFSIPTNPRLDICDSTDPVHLFANHYADYDMFKKTQSFRLGLLVVCQALHPMAEGLLYSRIGLGIGSLQSSQFQEAVMRFSSSKTGHKGEVTTHLWILGASQATSQRLDIRTLFPSLRYLHAHNADHVFQYCCPPKDLGWSIGVTTFKSRYGRLTWLDLEKLSVCFPNLTSLQCWLSNAEPRDVDKPGYIAFPRLVFLSVIVNLGHVLPLHNLRLPSLKCLSVKCDGDMQFGFLENLLGALRGSLVCVDLDVSSPSSPSISIRVDHLVLGAISTVETLTYHLDLYHPPLPDDAFSSIQSHKLRHLIISMFVAHQTIKMTGIVTTYIKPFTSRRAFPHLDQITLDFTEGWYKEPLGASSKPIVEAVQTLFPYARVEGINTNYY